MALPEEFIERLALHDAAIFYTGNTIAVLDIGMQIFMCIYGLSAFIGTSPELRKGRRPYVLLSFAILVLSGIPACLDLAMGFKALYGTGSGLDYIRARQRGYHDAMATVSQTLFHAYVALGDGLLVLTIDDSFGDVISFGMTFGFIGLSLTNIVRIISKTARSTELQAVRTQQITIAYTFLTVSLNVIATSLIAYRLVRAQRSFSRTLPGRGMRVYRAAARILVESALPLTLFGLCAALFGVVVWFRRSEEDGSLDLGSMVAGDVFGALYASFARLISRFISWNLKALAPQMIIFRVTTGRSWHTRDADLHTSVDVQNRLSQPILFNHQSVSISVGDVEDARGIGEGGVQHDDGIHKSRLEAPKEVI
ncbi:hypothetical protein CC1G_09204 [Coprinopsis cinerea okayama7|uniref:Uncharacterized protein n=1 Tax=Coprinopsis cinerea (strain Okayama-7 / 130 / ATCC MYA-4618 / FGSC 9003) TaxID=240176 RepID=A8P4W6_COPC7|nr:hypothetical protein CC1G_09204 [Coprinopsis cinerea okayama7\|eukprot:XP_001838827.2 hypothetical protein CC1G_09204 [Coprinopsis cinerea okayama7\